MHLGQRILSPGNLRPGMIVALPRVTSSRHDAKLAHPSWKPIAHRIESGGSFLRTTAFTISVFNSQHGYIPATYSLVYKHIGYGWWTFEGYCVYVYEVIPHPKRCPYSHRKDATYEIQ